MDEIFFPRVLEDGRVEQTLCGWIQPKRIALVGSGGCTAFSLLSDDVEAVHAIDINPGQCAIIDLKRAAIVALDRTAYLAFIGEHPCCKRVETYGTLRNHVHVRTRDYWDVRLDSIRSGIDHAGVTARFYYEVATALRLALGEDALASLFACSSLDEQGKLINAIIHDGRWMSAIATALGADAHRRHFPAGLFENDQGADPVRFFMQRLLHESSVRLLRSNYFLRQMLGFGYLYNEPDGSPYYLTADGYAQAQRNANRLYIHCSSFAWLPASVTHIDCFALSNIFDWSDDDIRRAIGTEVLRTRTAGAAMVYRSMFAPVDPSAVMDASCEIDASCSAQLFEMERSMMYSAVTVVRL